MMKAGVVPFEVCNLAELVAEAVVLQYLVFDYLHCSRCSNCFYGGGDVCHVVPYVMAHHLD